MSSLRLAVLGHPVAHSRSPAMHNAALAALGLPGRYRAIDVSGENGMATLARAVESGALHGANITMPYKGLAHRLAGHLTDEARTAGSVNTWFRRDGELWGASTDVEGITLAWQRRALPEDAPVLVLGAGGAARAALVALAGRELYVSARNAERAAELEAFGAEVVPWASPVRSAVVVNCTPLGMGGEELPRDLSDSAVAVFDMAYGAEPTPAVADARARKIPVADGLDLLVAQAAASFRLWTGVFPPADTMEDAARNVSRG